MAWAGPDAQEVARSLVGPAKKAPAGTIRGDFCCVSGRNVVHSSDSVDSAQRELDLWFDADREIFYWSQAIREWIEEDDDRADDKKNMRRYNE
jgi:nucleoside-diphosphate kinase